jgi:hypothetical protein
MEVRPRLLYKLCHRSGCLTRLNQDFEILATVHRSMGSINARTWWARCTGRPVRKSLCKFGNTEYK